MIVNVDMRVSMFDKTLQAGFSYGKRGEKIAVLQSTNKYLEWKPEYISHPSFTFCYVQATTRVSKLVNLRPPSKKARRSAPTRCSKPARLSVPWGNEMLPAPHPPDEVQILGVDEEDEENGAPMAEPGAYQQVCEKTRAPLSVGRGGGFHLISSPCIRWLRMQYEPQSKPSCPTKVTQVFFRSEQK